MTGYQAIGCGGSCFGRSNKERGIRGFLCSNNEMRLIDCNRSTDTTATCTQNAGVVCSKSGHPSSQQYYVYLLQLIEQCQSAPRHSHHPGPHPHQSLQPLSAQKTPHNSPPHASQHCVKQLPPYVQNAHRPTPAWRGPLPWKPAPAQTALQVQETRQTP